VRGESGVVCACRAHPGVMRACVVRGPREKGENPRCEKERRGLAEALLSASRSPWPTQTLACPSHDLASLCCDAVRTQGSKSRRPSHPIPTPPPPSRGRRDGGGDARQFLSTRPSSHSSPPLPLSPPHTHTPGGAPPSAPPAGYPGTAPISKPIFGGGGAAPASWGGYTMGGPPQAGGYAGQQQQQPPYGGLGPAGYGGGAPGYPGAYSGYPGGPGGGYPGPGGGQQMYAGGPASGSACLGPCLLALCCCCMMNN